MKKKLIIAGAVFCTVITAALLVARFTGMLLVFSIPTPSSLPTLKPGDYIYASNLTNPQPYHFIIFTSENADSINMVNMPEYSANSRYVHRLCGMPGDIIEMKKGVFYVNNKNFDEKLNLNIEYRISMAEFLLIEDADLDEAAKWGAMRQISQDSASVTIDSVLLRKYASKIKPTLYLTHDNQFGSFKWMNAAESWTVDNFGPIKIPADSYFVMGDNRHSALDSRYIGFVKKENIKAVVLNK